MKKHEAGAFRMHIAASHPGFRTVLYRGPAPAALQPIIGISQTACRLLQDPEPGLPLIDFRIFRAFGLRIFASIIRYSKNQNKKP